MQAVIVEKMKMMICPLHLHNAAALPWEKINFRFSAFDVVFSGSMWVAVEKSQFLVLRWGCRKEMDRIIADVWSDPPLAAIQAVKHLVKFTTALLMCSRGSSFQMVCKPTYNSSIVSGFGWGVWYLSSTASSGFKSAEFGGNSFLSMNPGQFACSRSCVTQNGDFRD